MIDALTPNVRTYAGTSRSPAAFAALYGLDGRSGSVSVEEPPASRSPYTSSVDTCTSRDARLANVLEQHLRPAELGAAEVLGGEDRAVDVGLGGEVDDRVAAARCARDVGGLRDVAVVELDVRRQIRAVARVRQLVEHDDVVARREQALDEMRADEARAACDEDPHRRKVSARRPAAGGRAAPASTSSTRRAAASPPARSASRTSVASSRIATPRPVAELLQRGRAGDDEGEEDGDHHERGARDDPRRPRRALPRPRARCHRARASARGSRVSRNTS